MATSDFYVGLREHGHEVGVRRVGQYTRGALWVDWRIVKNGFETSASELHAGLPFFEDKLLLQLDVH